MSCAAAWACAGGDVAGAGGLLPPPPPPPEAPKRAAVAMAAPVPALWKHQSLRLILVDEQSLGVFEKGPFRVFGSVPKDQ